MVFSHRATVYLWSLHFYSQMFKKTSNPASCSTGVFPLYFAPLSRLLSLLPWHCRRKWLTLLTTVLTKTHIFKGRLICARKQTGTFLRSPSPLRSSTARFHTLITSRLQSKQLISLIIDPMFSQVLPPIFCSPSSLLTPLCSQRFLQTPGSQAPLLSRLHANPCLDCRLTGF